MRSSGETFGFSPDHHHIAHTSQKPLQTPELVSARFQDSCRDDGSGEAFPSLWYLVIFLELQRLADPLQSPLVGQLGPLSPQSLLQLLLTHLKQKHSREDVETGPDDAPGLEPAAGLRAAAVKLSADVRDNTCREIRAPRSRNEGLYDHEQDASCRDKGAAYKAGVIGL